MTKYVRSSCCHCISFLNPYCLQVKLDVVALMLKLGELGDDGIVDVLRCVGDIGFAPFERVGDDEFAVTVLDFIPVLISIVGDVDDGFAACHGCPLLESILIECDGGIVLKAVDDRLDIIIICGAKDALGFLFGGAEYP